MAPGRPPQKVRGRIHGIGAWTPNYRRWQVEQSAARIRAWNQDALIQRGHLVSLYIPVVATTPGAVACTCQKATSQGSSERPCLTCYGAKFAPGYQRFMYDTIFFASAEHLGFTLTGAVIETSIKPHRIGIADGLLSAVLETPDKPFDNPTATITDWAVDVAYALRTLGSTATTEFSTDAGATWDSIAAVNGVNQPVGAGNIRFRVTLTRPTVDDEGPAFEIIRLRRPRREDIFRFIPMMRPDYTVDAPGIFVLRTPSMLQPSLESIRGRQQDHVADKGWTAPLDFYDTSLTADSAPCRIDWSGTEPNPFYEITDGTLSPRRYTMNNLAYSEELGTLTRQVWDDRLAQGGEWVYAVF